MLQGLMMDTQLLITGIMQFAEQNHGDREIVSAVAGDGLHRYTYKEAFKRSRKLANALSSRGCQQGDRIATLAWNDHRHFEIYYGVTCSGLVCHTINPRLFPAQIEYIINHAEDRIVFLDPAFVPLLEAMQAELPTVEAYVILTDEQHLPDSDLANVASYESWLGAENDEFDWPELDENTASALCYTSGTTGNPKGVLFSHRSTVLHSYGIALPDVMSLGERECILPIVPMFHVNAWGVPYAAPMVGAKLVLPGPHMADGAKLQKLIEQEQVSYALGVPTVWLALLAHLEETAAEVNALERVCVGGAACPAHIIDVFAERYNVKVFHAWGMTEMSPVGTYNKPKAKMLGWAAEALETHRLRQGRAFFGIEMKIVSDAGDELPWDGQSFGALRVRGPWVCKSYFGNAETNLDHEGWFDTGDVATIDPDGFMLITDRTKDVIKSGGEWVSSIELENTAVNHPDVAEAAAIGRPHPKWGERPLLIVVRVAGSDLDREALLGWYQGKVAKWWIPDDVMFVDQLPHTATGKIKKTALRDQYSDYSFPDSVS